MNETKQARVLLLFPFCAHFVIFIFKKTDMNVNIKGYGLNKNDFVHLRFHRFVFLYFVVLKFMSHFILMLSC